MCRIAGIFDRATKTLPQDIITMRDAMYRGGPDDAGVYIDEDFSLALGHRRLALIDLTSAGHQPMEDAEGQLQLIFNGEIYNFKELKSELVGKGLNFKTHSDTEVILKAYQAWGTDCFERFEGMFAIALFDKRKSIIVLGRDHAGIKPLYYSLENEKFIFASEIRAFKALNPHWQADENWETIFLSFGHLPEPVTTLKNVQQLPKGSFAIFNLQTLNLGITNYFKYDFTEKIFNVIEAKEVIREKLRKSVERHLIADAPIGLFLSGGIDSSLLTLLAQPILKERLHTLSIIFEEQHFSEKKYQDIIIQKTGARHQSFKITRQEFEDSLDDIILAMDQPTTDGINTYFISKCAHEAGLKAVLSGLGGDELFGGYTSFSSYPKLKQFRPIAPFVTPLLGRIDNKFKKLSYLNLNGSLSYYLSVRGLLNLSEINTVTGITPSEIEDRLESLDNFYACDISNPWTLASWCELNLYMQNQLLKDSDCMSMWHALEIRVPFLDKEFMNAVTSISTDLKQDKIGKFLLIESFKDKLPVEIWNRKRQGFTFPFTKWIDNKIENGPKILDGAHWSKVWAVKILNSFNEKN